MERRDQWSGEEGGEGAGEQKAGKSSNKSPWLLSGEAACVTLWCAGGTRDTVWVRDIYKSRVWHMSYKKGAEGGRCFKWLPIPHHFFIKLPILLHWPLFILWGVVKELVSGDPSPKVVLLNNHFLSQTSFKQETETARRGAIRCLLSPEIGQLWAEIASQMWPLMWGLGMLLLAPFNIHHCGQSENELMIRTDI